MYEYKNHSRRVHVWWICNCSNHGILIELVIYRCSLLSSLSLPSLPLTLLLLPLTSVSLSFPPPPPSHPPSLPSLPPSHSPSLLLHLTLQVCEGHWKCWDCKLFDWSSEQPVHPPVPDRSSPASAAHYLQPACSCLQCPSLHQPPSLCRGPETQNPPSHSLHTPRNPRYSTTSHAATLIHTVYGF